MAISPLVQSNSKNAGSVNSSGLAFANDNVAGNLLVCGVRYGPASVAVTVSDSQGNSWLEVDDIQGPTNGVWLFYAPNCDAGPNTVTVLGGGTPTGMRFAIAEYPGADLSLPLDVSTTASSASGNQVQCPLATNFDGDLLVIVHGSSVSSAATGGSAQYTVEEQQTNFFAFTDGFGVAAGSEIGLVNLATTCTWNAVMAAFRPQVDAISPTLVPVTRHRIYEYTYQC